LERGRHHPCTPARAALAAFRRIAREVLDHGTYDSMIDDTFTYDEMQRLLQAGSGEG